MDEEPTKDLATRAFQKRVLDEFAAMRQEQAAMRQEQAAMRQDISQVRTDIAEIRSQQAAMARNIATLDQRLTSVEQRLGSLETLVEVRLKETRPIWEALQLQIRRLDQKFDLVIRDFYDVRLDLQNHERRLAEL